MFWVRDCLPLILFCLMHACSCIGLCLVVFHLPLVCLVLSCACIFVCDARYAVRGRGRVRKEIILQVKIRDSQGHQASHHLLLHTLILYFYAYALVTKNAFLFLWRGCLWHSDTTPNYTTPVGAAIRIEPIVPEIAERVLNTFLSLEAPFG